MTWSGVEAMNGRFEDWYREAWPDLVGSLTLHAPNVEAARDATAEALVQVYVKWERIGAMRNPTGYAYVVARNILRRQARRERIEQRLLGRERPVMVGPPAVFDLSLWAALRALPDRQRTAVALRYVLDLTQEQVAEAMQVSPGTAASTLNAARARLGDILRPELIEELPNV